MAVIGYTPAPEGLPGYMFQNDAGGSVHLYGPEADGLKSWIDRTKPADARIAYDPAAPFGSAASIPDAPPAPPVSVPDVPPNMSAAPPPPAMSVAPPTPRPPVALPGAARVMSQPAPPRPAGIQPPEDINALPVLSGGGEGEPQGPSHDEQLKQSLQQVAITTGLQGHYHPGRVAVDPNKLAAEGVPVPVSETVQGSLPETPEEQKARLEHQQLREAQREEQLAAFKAATAETAAAYDEQRVQALDASDKALADERASLARKKAIEDEYNATFARVQKERDAAMSAGVDPNRIFRGEKNTGAAIGSAIAVGLGAFGSALTHGPNYAQQIVSAAIDRDVDAQKDQIARKGAAAQNTIAEMQRKYGLSIEEASGFVKEAQLRYAASRAQMQAARLGNAEAQQKAAAFALDMLGKADKERLDWEEIYRGRKTTQYAVVQPQKATAGYYSGPTLQDVTNTVNAVTTAQKGFKDASGKPGKLSARLGATQAVNRSAQEDLINLEKADPGGWIQPDNPLWTSDSRIQLDASAKAVAAKVLAGNGEPVTEEGLHAITSQLTAKNPDIRKKAREYVKKGLETADKYIEQQRGGIVESSSSSEGEQ